MKDKAVICIVVLILALISTGIGCDSTKGEGAVDMMKKVPKYTDSFMFIDVDAMRIDADLEKAYIDVKDILEEGTVYVGINHDEVDRMAYTGTSTILLEGDFNLDEAREKLEVLGYGGDEYRGIEVWEAVGLLIALVSNELVILGTEDVVKDCIKIIKDGDASLYDDKDFRDVMERLPSGIIVQCMERVFPLSYGQYEGLEVAGMSAMKKDKHSMAFTGICKFENRDDASDAMDEIEFSLENDEFDDWRKIDVTHDSEFVVITTEIYIDDVFDVE